MCVASNPLKASNLPLDYKDYIMFAYDWLRLAEETHREALVELERQRAGGEDVDEDLPFNFPRMLGSEITSRWEMQRFPPDLSKVLLATQGDPGTAGT